MGAISAVESWFLLASALAAVAVASWSAVCSFGKGVGGSRTGELTWALVAATILLGVGALVWNGASHAG